MGARGGSGSGGRSSGGGLGGGRSQDRLRQRVRRQSRKQRREGGGELPIQIFPQEVDVKKRASRGCSLLSAKNAKPLAPRQTGTTTPASPAL